VKHVQMFFVVHARRHNIHWGGLWIDWSKQAKFIVQHLPCIWFCCVQLRWQILQWLWSTINIRLQTISTIKPIRYDTTQTV